MSVDTDKSSCSSCSIQDSAHAAGAGGSDEPHSCQLTDADLPLYEPGDHRSKFKPELYLNAFYRTPHEEGAMSMVLFFLPSMCYRMSKCDTMLDVGCGPTIYTAVAFRHHCKHIYLSDYCPENRRALKRWKHSCAHVVEANNVAFDWRPVINWLRSLESTNETAEQMAKQAQDRVVDILPCDVYDKQVLQVSPAASSVPNQFDLVTSIFCLEYASGTRREYDTCIDNVMGLVWSICGVYYENSHCLQIKPGGYLLLGGVCQEEYYKFGGMKFRCHRLEIEHVLEALQRNNFSDENDTKAFKLVERDGIFVLLAQKRS